VETSVLVTVAQSVVMETSVCVVTSVLVAQSVAVVPLTTTDVTWLISVSVTVILPWVSSQLWPTPILVV
jgi:branched-subunit amino acid permease